MGNKPQFLYHGSRRFIDVLEPQQARGGGTDNKDKLYAIYATQVRNFAIAFALPKIPTDERGFSWSMETSSAEPAVTIENGYLDIDGFGYVYKVPADTFEPIDDHQWVSYVPVKPFDYEIVYSSDYINWFK